MYWEESPGKKIGRETELQLAINRKTRLKLSFFLLSIVGGREYIWPLEEFMLFEKVCCCLVGKLCPALL